ncbi:MAG: permease-like cell division protein FtsX [Candidatus Pacebacteria bacterium]|nr:permease-like cell division protein FtsX [Candidatus Paceibacterota bacterium]
MKNSSTTFKRIFKSGTLNFFRNKTVSISSVAILTTTLLIIGIFFFFRGIFDYTLGEIKDKVDIKVYLKLEASDTQITSLKQKIMTLSEVKSVNLTTANDALDEFKNKHSNDAITMQALEELNTNPFGAVLTIIAQDTNSYESIAQTLDSGSQFLGDSSSIIDRINYYELKSSIDKLNNIVNWVNIIGYWITLIFIIMSSLIIFNTIRLSIFIYKDEISVMRLVGASNFYIRGPFLIESTIYAFVSSSLAMLLFSPITYYIAKKTAIFLNGLNIYKYYLTNFFSLFALLLIVSLLLATVSSMLATRKYLKI